MPKARINYALAATLLTTGATYDEIAPQVGAKNAQSVRLGLLRKGVTITKVRQLPTPNEGSQPVILRVAQAAGQIVRERLAKDLEDTTLKLSETKHKKGLKHLKERVEVLEPLTRTASKLFGWEGSTETPFAMLFFDKEEAVQGSIDVQSSVEPTTGSAQPESSNDPESQGS